MIHVTGLTKRFGATTAVDDLTFSVEPGRVTGFVGPNGSGKTTTMRLIMGLDRPTSGIATIGGRPYRAIANPLREVGALLDARWVHPNRVARAHLRWVAASNGIAAARVDEVLDLVGLTSVAGKKVGGFSLGMLQRLGIATALLGDPPTLMFDEPVNGLDPDGIRWVRMLMRRLAAEGRTVLVSSHLLTELAQTADDLVVIGRGRLLADTTMAEFIEANSERSVVVRTPDAERLGAELVALGHSAERDGERLVVAGVTTDAVGDVAADLGVRLHELAGRESTLEDAYLRLVAQTAEYQAASGREMGDAR